jgi:ABC-type phosphate transport system substrate-binding protein
MIAATLAAAALGGTVMAGVAGADGTNPPTSGTGWDDKVDRIVGGGSDTTYAWHQLAERIYNQAGGCRVITSSSSPVKGNCTTPPLVQDQTDATGNWDHDVTVSAYPTGSSAGVADLLSGSGRLYDYARSSRGPKTSGETGTEFWGVAKDAVGVVTFAGRPTGNLTDQDIKDIYNCTKTDWSQVGGGLMGSGPIVPIGMNPDSGTYATFQSFIGVAPNNGACVVGLNGTKVTYPFENDAKQISENTWLNANRSNAIWWMSAASWKAYDFKRQDSALNNVNGRSPINPTQVLTGQYPITRFIYHVTKATDAAPVGSTDEVTGGTSGKPGAVREFTEFLCKGSGRHGLNEYSGLSNGTELSKATSDTGFIGIPSNQRTNGICAVVAAP